jgi:hypothetical protein
MMIETSEDGICDGIAWNGIVISDSKTIYAYQVRAARQAKLKRLAKRVLRPILE